MRILAFRRIARRDQHHARNIFSVAVGDSEAERISVSIRSCTTRARAGITERSSASFAVRHSAALVSCAHPHHVAAAAIQPSIIHTRKRFALGHRILSYPLSLSSVQMHDAPLQRRRRRLRAISTPILLSRLFTCVFTVASEINSALRYPCCSSPPQSAAERPVPAPSASPPLMRSASFSATRAGIRDLPGTTFNRSDNSARSIPFSRYPFGPRLQRAINIFVSIERRQHDDPGSRKFLADACDSLHAVHLRQSQIHQRHIRLMLAELLHRFLSIRSFRNHRKAGHRLQQCRKALAHDVMIVNQQDVNRIRHSYVCFSVSRLKGSASRTVVPSPCSLSTVSVDRSPPRAPAYPLIQNARSNPSGGFPRNPRPIVANLHPEHTPLKLQPQHNVRSFPVANRVRHRFPRNSRQLTLHIFIQRMVRPRHMHLHPRSRCACTMSPRSPSLLPPPSGSSRPDPRAPLPANAIPRLKSARHPGCS